MTNKSNTASLVLGIAAVAALLGATALTPARADDAAPAAAPAGFWDTFAVTGYLEGGITANPDSPSNGLNFGQLYTDRSNVPVLNQASIMAGRPTDPKATDYDFGFNLWAMYGTDARYTHFYNEFDRSINSRYQFDIVEAKALFHLPWIPNGIDATVGQFVTPMGYEVINPSGNPFYSHSYIYNFGLPVKNTGTYAVAHATDILDIYFGADFGNLAQFGSHGDNNSSLAGFGGFGLNLMDGKLTIVALTHIGPENPDTALGGVVGANGLNRFFNDAVITYKASDALTLVTELNYVRDDIFSNARAYGFAQYASYTLSDMLTLNGRAELWRDRSGFFTAAFPGNFDFTDSARGLSQPNGNPATTIFGGTAVYSEFTVGVTVKPPVPDMIKGLMVRPEIRWDHDYDSPHPYDDATNSNQVTIAADLFVPF